MKVKNTISIFFFLLTNFLFSQYTLEAIIVDKQTNKPIEMVNVYNKNNFVLTNEQGQFYFTSLLNTVSFKMLGYHDFKATIDKLSKNDTIFLEPKFVELDEVVLDKNYKIKELKKAIQSLYPRTPYQERFFLRAILQKDDKIVKIEDIVGKVRRKALFTNSKDKVPKRNYDVEIEQLRKVGIEAKGMFSVDFRMHSFNELFHTLVAIFASPKFYDFKEVGLQDENFEKLTYKPKDSKKQFLKGYYIINSKDNALSETMLINDVKGEFKKTITGVNYRTTLIKRKINFEKSEISNKYYIDKARLDETIEYFKKDGKYHTYKITYILKTQNNFEDLKINGNTSVKKEIFNVKGKYNADFWNTQHHLKLTDEMREFIDNLNTQNSKEYRQINNMNKQ